MKKNLTILLLLAICFQLNAQNSSRQPKGFRKAELPASLKENIIIVNPKDQLRCDAGIPTNKSERTPSVTSQSNTVPTPPFLGEYTVGTTYYDLQTNSSINNRIVSNSDSSFAIAWNFCPAYDPAEAFPQRGTGYNYSTDGINWIFPFGPPARIENTRTGSTNIVNTTSGSELSIAHTGTSIALTYRATKGTGSWTTTTPWGSSNNDTWPRAVAGGNNMVYTIFQGSGVSNVPALGQLGPLFFSRSTDGGISWSPKAQIPGTDSTQYTGFGGEDYAIDAKGNTVAIVLGDPISDLILLKSTDAGITWTKTYIYQSPLPLFDPSSGQISDTNADGIADTLLTPAGDHAILIDDNDLCHVWFREMKWMCDQSTPGNYSLFQNTEGIQYWTENMGTYGNVFLIGAEDLNGNGILDLPQNQMCLKPFGTYGSGLTGMPSAGQGDDGTIYLTYQSIDELADTTQFYQAHYHIYLIYSLDYGTTWSTPYDIVPSIANGGDGENQEAVFASLPKRIHGNVLPILYQRDRAPGHALASAGGCDDDNNSGNLSDIIFARYDIPTLTGIKNTEPDNLFITQAYPNPTTGITNFNITTKNKSDISITITDQLGKIVYTEIKNNISSGTNVIILNTSKWNAGLYTYTVISGNQKASKRIAVQ